MAYMHVGEIELFQYTKTESYLKIASCFTFIFKFSENKAKTEDNFTVY